MTRILSIPALLAGLVALAAPVLLATGCGPADHPATANGTGEVHEAGPQEQPLPVVAVEVDEGPISSSITASGNLEAIEIVDILAKVPGQIEQLLVEEGTEVAADDTLMQLDPTEYRLAADRAEAEVDKRRDDLGRYDRMLAEGVLAQSDYDQARYELRQAELALEQARVDLRYTSVQAPIAGIVSSRNVHLGARVTANQHLFTVVNPQRLWVQLHVPEAELPGLKPGLSATLSSDVLPGFSFSGSVERISPVVDPNSGTGKVTIVVDSGDRQLRPGMFVNVRIVTDNRERALLIPKRAIVYPDEQPAVFRVDGSEEALTVTLVSIVLGNNSGDRVEVREGLNAGDRIVILGQEGLRSGIAIRIVDSGKLGFPFSGQ
ncbi:MAG: efflux RND transporter periplasmic adaptor subunit [Acidobacteriota bacterium]